MKYITNNSCNYLAGAWRTTELINSVFLGAGTPFLEASLQFY